MTLGEQLRKVREKNGMSLTELQEKTKISLNQLEALERNDYQALGDYNTRVILHAYASTFGLDTEALIQLYEDGGLIRDDGEAPSNVRNSRTEQYAELNSRRKKYRMVPVIILTLVFLLVVGSVSYAFVKEHNRYNANSDVQQEYKVDNQATKEVVSSKKEKEPEPVVSSQAPKKEKMALEVISSSAGQVNMKANHIDGNAKLSLTGSNGRCWVSVQAAGQSLYQGVVESGQTQTVEIPSKATNVSIRLGNVSALEMKLNDEKIDYGSTQSKQMTINMTLDYQS